MFADQNGRMRNSLLEKQWLRLTILCAAYLREKRIIHRDINPENIGFDIGDDMFCLGMARDAIAVRGDP